jgi:hypothetical protein
MFTILTILIIVIFAIYIYTRMNNKIEKFEQNQKVYAKTTNNKFFTICAGKHLCLTNDFESKTLFSIMKFSDDLISLSNNGYYVASCFGDKCIDNMIKVNSFNPYAPNAKLKLTKEGDYYYVQFYDDMYLSVDENDNLIKTSDKLQSIQITFI